MDSTKAEKLALARKKLREFESRKQRDNGFSPTPSGNSSTYNDQIGSTPQSCSTDPNGRASAVSNVSGTGFGDVHSLQMNGGLTGSENGTEGTVLQGTSLDRAPANGFVSNSATQLEVERLRALLREKESAHQQVSGQLQELHGYYSQLHAAYQDLSQREMAEDGDGGGAAEQISQLQAALSGLVAEKTSLQADLRLAREQLEEHKTHLSFKASSHAEEADKRERAQTEVSKLQAELEEKNRMLERRHTELDSERKESSRLQAQMLTLQHDKNEAQARLKNVYQSKEMLESELKNLRKECQMKDLYIKQLASHSGQSSIHTGQDDYAKLQEESDSLKAELARLNMECIAAKQEAEEARTHYNEYGKQMNENYSRLNKEYDELSSNKFELDSRICDLEDQLEVATEELKKVRAAAAAPLNSVDSGGHLSVSMQSTAGSVSEEEVSRKVEDAVQKAVTSMGEKYKGILKEAENSAVEKDRMIFEREQSIAELQIKLRFLEETRKELSEGAGELLSISEQLQNEKATVSRAVAQNKELKEQLIETEDRLIALTQEKLESELARQTAEHAVRELQKLVGHGQVSDHHESVVAPPGSDLEMQKNLLSMQDQPLPLQTVVVSQPETALAGDALVHRERGKNADNVEDDEGSVSTDGADFVADGERAELERQLLEMGRHLEEVRAELRRSNTQNEQMNQIMRQNAEDENQNSILVELDQAVARINALAHENETLREEVESLRYSPDESNSRNLASSHAQGSLGTANEANQVEIEAATLRIHQLREENEILSDRIDHLTRDLNDAHAQLESTRMEESIIAQRDSPPISPVSRDEPSSCKGHSRTDSKERVVGSAEWARVELERRFSEAMRQVAELQERCDRFEHISVQLQLENDTIADHVILYQHQRRLIRERLRQKDEQMAILEKERERVIGRCQELQEALVHVLGESGALKKYSTRPARGRARGERVGSRSYSHSTVDELSGDEDLVVDAKDQKVPTRDPSVPAVPDVELAPSIRSLPSGSAAEPSSSNVANILHSPDSGAESGPDALTALRNSPVSSRPSSPSGKEAAVKRILEIIQDIKTPAVPLPSARMQCKQCIGELQHL